MTKDRLVGGWLLLTVTEDLVGAGSAGCASGCSTPRLGTAIWCWT